MILWFFWLSSLFYRERSRSNISINCVHSGRECVQCARARARAYSHENSSFKFSFGVSTEMRFCASVHNAHNMRCMRFDRIQWENWFCAHLNKKRKMLAWILIETIIKFFDTHCARISENSTHNTMDNIAVYQMYLLNFQHVNKKKSKSFASVQNEEWAGRYGRHKIACSSIANNDHRWLSPAKNKNNWFLINNQWF